jgi:large subunit ribosomal protein L31
VKEGIHPTWYPEATVACACGNTWTTGSTLPEIRTDVCSNCHPFYTGEQRIVDTEGQVDRFMKRLEARDAIKAEQDAVEAEKVTPALKLEELELTSRTINVLNEGGIATAGDFVSALEEGGDDALLAIKGFGRKGLADVKRRLKELGYALPETAG